MASTAINDRSICEQGRLSHSDGRLRRLAAQFGVAASYRDESGVRRLVNDQSLRRILSVMEIEADDSGQLNERMCEARSARWQTMLDPVLVVKVDRLLRTLPADSPREAHAIPQLTDELCRAVYAYLSRTPSWLLLISLEDLVGDIETPNVPGEHAYPSWRVKAGPSGSTWEDWTRLTQVLMMAQTINSRRHRG